tara:strand:- start:133 stop:381 length:249 start_codon:yes stop_codon:yes gene_type:complete
LQHHSRDEDDRNVEFQIAERHKNEKQADRADHQAGGETGNQVFQEAAHDRAFLVAGIVQDHLEQHGFSPGAHLRVPHSRSGT